MLYKYKKLVNSNELETSNQLMLMYVKKIKIVGICLILLGVSLLFAFLADLIQ